MGGGVYINGTSATISATPKPGYTFSGWSGACSGTGRCVVTMNGNKTVTANFSLTPATRPTSTSSAWSYYDKGQEYFDAENWSMAIEQFTLALQVNPQWEDAYFYRGYAYDELGQYQRAIQDYNKAIEIDPNDATNYVVRAVTYRNLGQFTLADADTTTACSLESQWC